MDGIKKYRLNICTWNGEVNPMNELIDALRKILMYQDSEKRNICHDAADAIERLMDEVDRKDKALQAWVKTWESRKENAIRHICDHCDTPIEVRLKEGACEDCPIITLVKEIFDEQP